MVDIPARKAASSPDIKIKAYLKMRHTPQNNVILIWRMITNHWIPRHPLEKKQKQKRRTMQIVI